MNRKAMNLRTKEEIEGKINKITFFEQLKMKII